MGSSGEHVRSRGVLTFVLTCGQSSPEMRWANAVVESGVSDVFRYSYGASTSSQ
jgi:hypothetical protein